MLNNKINQQPHAIKHSLMAKTVLLVLLTTILGGCVSSSSYEEVSKERDELIKKQRAMEGNTKYLRNKVESTEEQTARLQSELNDVQSQLAEASRSLETKNNELKKPIKKLHNIPSYHRGNSLPVFFIYFL